MAAFLGFTLLHGIGVPAEVLPQTRDPALVRTPANIRANRTLPAFTPVSEVQPVSDNPTDEEIGRLRLFPERLVPVKGEAPTGLRALFSSKSPASDNQDNRHVSGTLRALQAAQAPFDTTHLEAFLKAHPQSRWAAAMRQEYARRDFKQGWFAQAIAGWDKLWDELKNRRDSGAVEVANETLSQLIDAHIGLGNAERLARLIGEQESRPGHPVIQAKILRARQSVWLLSHKGSQNVMCGPVALYCILQNRQQLFTPVRLNDITDDYIATGISLSQLQKYAAQYQMDLVMARKRPGDPIPTPSVMHLASGHFSAVLVEDHGDYLLEDRPMQFKGWVSLAALEAQSSGYFLIPAGSVPDGWQLVSEQAGSRIFGRDGMHGQEPLNQSITRCSPTTGGDKPNCGGMPYYTFHQQVASLRLQDTPVGYRPPVGPWVFTTIAYNDLDDSKPVGPPAFSNVGRIWSINWLAYAEITFHIISINGVEYHFPDYPVTVHVAGGGTEVYRSSAPHDRSFATVLISTNGAICTRILPDGSQEVYNTGGSLGPFFLSQYSDASRNAESFTYDANLRLVAITDAIGQVTTFEHNWPRDIWKVTKITDPFGRFATFSYGGGNGDELSSVTDVLGLTTTFGYDTNEFLISMTTPYGTTTFTNSRPAVPGASYDYSLTATDPAGNKEKVHYLEPYDVPPLGPPLPGTIMVGGTPVSFVAEDARLNFRNSFYWDKRAMKLGPEDFTLARNYRWLTDASYLITPILEAMKETLENRVWFNHPGHTGGSPYASYPYYPGLGGQPEKTLRMLSDGTPQLTQTYYNRRGNVTNLIDPTGRSTLFIYATNQIDLIEVRQKNGTGWDRISLVTYNDQHLPLTYVDEAGQTNQFTYNARGQLQSYTGPLGQTTMLSYDTNGYLLIIDGPFPGTNDSTRFTYDGFGRIRTYAPPEVGAVTLDYDALDRPTVITYPDGTYEQFGYDRLDRSFDRDRLGRRMDFTYNSLRQIVQVKDALQRVTRFGWCECGVLTSLTDPLGRVTSWQYDNQNRVIGKQMPDGSTLSLVYDPATSRIKSVTDEKGQTKVYDYDLADNLRGISYPNAQVPTPAATFAYDSVYDRLTRMADGTGTTTWSYHPAGVLGALQVASVAASWNNAPVTYQYDALGRGTNRFIGGAGQGYAFDVLGRITNVVNALGRFTYAYDGVRARVADVVYPNGQKSHYDYYDRVGDRHLRRITHTAPNASVISQFDYAYDPVGNITNWIQALGATTYNWNVRYDAADQLTTAQVVSGAGSTNYTYNYDGDGNRLFEDVNGVRRDFNYNELNQLASSSDANTNAVTYEWDAEARLTAINRGTSRSEFSYDGVGRRVRIVEKQNGTTVSALTFLWCGAEICEWRDAGGSNVVRRIFSQGESVPGGTTANYYYTKDHLGSVREALDPNGVLASRYRYGPFGAASAVQEAFQPASGFAGYFAHRVSGLNLTAFRALNCDAGRWLSRDPLQEQAGVNLYAYVRNRPLLVTDPLGLDGPSCARFDVSTAVQKLNEGAKDQNQSRGRCAHFTMDAVDSGCYTDSSKNRPGSAYQFGTLLEQMGFQEVTTTDYQAGDIIIFDQGTAPYDHGHMQMYNGTQWVSDFMQKGATPMDSDRNWKNLKQTVYRHSFPIMPPKPCNSPPDHYRTDTQPPL